MRKLALMFLALVMSSGLGLQTANAIPAFQKVFLEQYIENHKDEEFAKYVKDKVKCYICHQGKKPGPHRNPYGKHLAKLLDKKKDAKDVDKIKAALAEVGKMHSDPKDDKSPTYDELIAASKLPSGMTLDDLKKDPPKDQQEEEEKEESK
jgi:hypothetical protein